ncbi:MAG TPA: NAD(P)H-dependent oxidoreductase [Terricaulis sp.]|nr:NAD(P)H-dependent oxidoreductase [Terricaulis sp.]HRP11610.1 NAD(P)H-dependent oxidoreductase [Terricaulis sp.]
MTKVAVIVGSLRKGSFNRQLAEALSKLARPRLDLQIVEIGDLPLYNQDDEAALPAPVERFKREIEAADAVLFVSPEYNRTFSAALKNAIEWGSRPWGKNSWAGKPGAIIGATPGAVGAAQAQSHLRSIAPILGVALLAQPEIYLNYREGQIVDGEIADEGVAGLLSGWVESFADWTAKLKAPARAA